MSLRIGRGTAEINREVTVVLEIAMVLVVRESVTTPEVVMIQETAATLEDIGAPGIVTILKDVTTPGSIVLPEVTKIRGSIKAPGIAMILEGVTTPGNIGGPEVIGARGIVEALETAAVLEDVAVLGTGGRGGVCHRHGRLTQLSLNSFFILLSPTLRYHLLILSFSLSYLFT